jgi:hypothetical protein
LSGGKIVYLKKLFKQIRENTEILVEQGVEMGSDLLLDGIAGQVAPGIVSFRLAYKQKQMEGRVNIANDLLKKRMDRVEKHLGVLNEEEYRFVEESVFPLVFENIIEETEDEKIKYIINGFESVIENKITDQEIVLSYLDVIKELRVIDIEHLFKQTTQYRDLISKEKQKLEIDLSEMGRRRNALTTYIHNKLEQLGLIQTVTFDEVPPEEGRVTKFGYNFIDFIKDKGKFSI